MIESLYYRTNEWRSKRKQILERDNFTCKKCGTFNPSEGIVTILNEKEQGIELHEYDSSACRYILTSQQNGITLNIDYGWGIWLVTPILQIHHKRYIEGKHPWEYENDDLITLCKACHNSGHQDIEIPIYDPNLNFITSKLFKPEDNNTGRNHDFKPWRFVNNYTGEYQLTSVQPSVSFFVFAKDLNRMAALESTANEMYIYFMERFLPDYMKGQN